MYIPVYMCTILPYVYMLCVHNQAPAHNINSSIVPIGPVDNISLIPCVATCIVTIHVLYTWQAVGYGLLLLDGNLVNVNKLQKKLNLSRVDRLFRVSVIPVLCACSVSSTLHIRASLSRLTSRISHARVIGLNPT